MEPYDPLIARAEARVGQVLRGKWRLDSLLGVGGMACVFAATHRNGRRGAVKMLHTELSLDRVFRARFLREGYVANKVGHPGTVAVLDDDVTEDGSVFLVMELLEGEALDRRWERLERRLPAAEVLYVADAVLDVLAAAHDQGIVHRDVKPENVFLPRFGRVKVLDFGIARARQTATATAATRTGTTLGTPAYMSPEQALGRIDEVDARSDLWAVGATMFTLIVGKHVHGGKTLNEQLIAAATRKAQPIAEVDPTVPSPVAAVIDRALAFERADRWQDSRAMQHAVREAFLEVVGTPLPDYPHPNLPSPEELARIEAERRKVSADSQFGILTTLKPATASHRATLPRVVPRWIAPTMVLAGLVIGTAAMFAWRKHVGPSQQPPPVAAFSSIDTTGPAPSAAPSAPSSRPTGEEASLAITSNGGSCQVDIDGTMKGATPWSGVLPPGIHEVSCTMTSGARLTQPVTLRAGEPFSVEFVVPSLAQPNRNPATGMVSKPSTTPSHTASATPANSTVDPRDRRK